MSHAIAEERKRIRNRMYYLNESYSGGTEFAEVVFHDLTGKNWGVAYRNWKRNACKEAEAIWNNLV